MRINRTLRCAGTLREPSKGKEKTMAPMRMVRRRKMMRVSGVRSESVIGCQRQKLQQTASNFPDVKMATGNVKFLRGTAYRNWPRQVLRTATIPAKLAGVISPTQ